MSKLLVILVVSKLYAWIDILKQIKKKQGQNVLNAVRKYERLLAKLIKLQADIKFIKTCKKKHLVPTLRGLIFPWIKFYGFREFGQNTRTISKCAIREIKSLRKITNFVIRENTSSRKFHTHKKKLSKDWISFFFYFSQKIHEIYLLIDDYCSCTVFVTARSTSILKKVSDVFSPLMFFSFLLRSALVFSRYYLF